jgi:hypothetical protein
MASEIIRRKCEGSQKEVYVGGPRNIAELTNQIRKKKIRQSRQIRREEWQKRAYIGVKAPSRLCFQKEKC